MQPCIAKQLWLLQLFLHSQTESQGIAERDPSDDLDGKEIEGVSSVSSVSSSIANGMSIVLHREVVAVSLQFFSGFMVSSDFFETAINLHGFLMTPQTKSKQWTTKNKCEKWQRVC